MRQPAGSRFGAVASSLRFAVITASLAIMALPLLAQEQPIPAELSFLNRLGKPYRITYEPWTAMHEWSSGGIMLFLHYRKDGVEARAETDPGGAERASMDMIEIAPMAFTFTLKQPAATPESVNATAGDFPWLGPLPS